MGKEVKKLVLFIFFSFFSICSFAQPQILNGISIDGPLGFEKEGDLTWTRGNDVISVMSINSFLSQEDYEDTCRKGTRTTKYLSSEKIKINGDDYIICIQWGKNELLIGQTVVFREGHSYFLTVGTYPGDYETSEQINKSYEQIGFMIGYMITRIKTF